MTSPPERRPAERLLKRIRTRVAQLRRLEQTRARTAANSNSDDARSPTAMNFISDPEQLEQLDLTILDE
jgi:hypothetical protein